MGERDMDAVRKAASESDLPYSEFVLGCIDLMECGLTADEAIECMGGDEPRGGGSG